MELLQTLQKKASAGLAIALCIAIWSPAWAAAKKPDPATEYLRQCVTAAKAFLASTPEDAVSLTSCSDERLAVSGKKQVTDSSITTKNGKLLSVKVRAGKRSLSYQEPKRQVRMRPSGRRTSLTCPGSNVCCSGPLCCKGTFCCRFSPGGAPRCGDGQT